MGCFASNLSSPDVKSYDPKQSVTFKKTNKLCPMVRLDSSGYSHELPIEGVAYSYSIRYCYVSQRG